MFFCNQIHTRVLGEKTFLFFSQNKYSKWKRRLLSVFILDKKKRKNFRNKDFIIKKSHTEKNNTIQIAKNFIGNIKAEIKGKNNSVFIEKGNAKINLFIFGDNCKVLIGEGFGSLDCQIIIGCDNIFHQPASNSVVSIGRNVSTESFLYFTDSPNTFFSLGDNCMLSKDISLYHTDGHLIQDKSTKKVLNKPKDMVIGNHVWIGAHATLLKNVHIPDDSIIGWGSVVNQKYADEKQFPRGGELLLQGILLRSLKSILHGI